MSSLINSHESKAAKALLESCETPLEFFLTDTGLKLLVGGHLSSPVLWPELAAHSSPNVQHFLRHRLPRWQRQPDTALDKRCACAPRL